MYGLKIKISIFSLQEVSKNCKYLPKLSRMMSLIPRPYRNKGKRSTQDSSCGHTKPGRSEVHELMATMCMLVRNYFDIPVAIQEKTTSRVHITLKRMDAWALKVTI